MAVVNLHTRKIDATASEVGAALGSLGSDTDKLWPRDRWPPIQFDRALGVGADGGHGPIRYQVELYVPGQLIRFRFTSPRGFDGFHEYTVQPVSEHTAGLRRLLVMRLHGLARLTWPLAIRWLHDAAIEDSLDHAERAFATTIHKSARWSGVVRLLRAVSLNADRKRQK
jgi:hypothetical protein